MDRRDFLLGTTIAVAGGLPAHAADAPGWHRAAFSARTFAEVVKALGGTAAESRDVAFVQAPEIAENGTSVRFAAQSNAPGTTQLAFVVEKNPFPLAALFEVPAGTDPAFTVHLKMGESSRVYAMAHVGGRWLYAVKSVTVTLGGCAA